MKLNKKRTILPYLVVSSIIAYAILNLTIEILGITYGPRLTDFDTNYHSSKRFLQGGSLYADAVAPNGSSRQFVYPPIAITLFIPFTFLPFTVAGILWNVTSLLLLSTSVTVLLHRLLKENESDLDSYLYLLVLGCVLGYAPTINWLKAGQASGVVATGLCLSIAYSLDVKRRTSTYSTFYSAIWIPLICSIKPYYAPSGAILLQDVKRFVYAAFSTIAIIGVSVILIGIEPHVSYITTVLLGEGSSFVFEIPPKRWNAGVYAPLHIFGQSAKWIRLSLAGLTAIFVLIRHFKGDKRLETALVGLAIIPIATPTRVDGLVALIPVFLVLLVRYWQNRVVRSGVLISIMLVQIHPYTIEFLVKLGPRYLPTLNQLTSVIPLLQPALWGHLLLLLTLGLVIHEGRDDGSDVLG